MDVPRCDIKGCKKKATYVVQGIGKFDFWCLVQLRGLLKDANVTTLNHPLSDNIVTAGGTV